MNTTQTKPLTTGAETPVTVDLRRFMIRLGSAETGGEPRYLDAVGIAREAEHADTDEMLAKARQGRFGDHLLMLASMCRDVDEFAAVCKEAQRQLDWGRGRSRPIPRTFTVYQSTIAGGWRTHGLRPFDAAEVPVLDGSKLKRDEAGNVIKERVKLDGINAFRAAKRALDIAAQQARNTTSDDRRSQARKDAERLKLAGFINAEAESAVQRVLWALKHTPDEERKRRFTEELNALTARYPIPEPFPQSLATRN